MTRSGSFTSVEMSEAQPDLDSACLTSDLHNLPEQRPKELPGPSRNDKYSSGSSHNLTRRTFSNMQLSFPSQSNLIGG